MRDGNRNYQKASPLFGKKMGITKKLLRYSGRERETQKSLPAFRESEFKAFPLGNIQEREFPLIPALTTVRLQLLEANSDSSSYIPHDKSTHLFK